MYNKVTHRNEIVSSTGVFEKLLVLTREQVVTSESLQILLLNVVTGFFKILCGETKVNNMDAGFSENFKVVKHNIVGLEVVIYVSGLMNIFEQIYKRNPKKGY